MAIKQIAPKKVKAKKERKKPIYYIAPTLLLVFIILLLEFLVVALEISRTVLPAPHTIWISMRANFMRDILPHMLLTLRVILTGYFVAIPIGMMIAAISSQFNLLIKAITPLNILLVVTPMITLVPLFMMWMGFDTRVRIIVVILQATPVIAINTLSGFSRTEREKLELMRSMGASRFQTFFKVVCPNALPHVFTGLKLGCIFSTIAAMSADIAAGREGLGFRIQMYAGLVMTEMGFGTILVVVIIGLTLFQIVSAIERRVVVWVK